MNRKEAVEALEKGKKLTHRFFTPEEWIEERGLEIYDEKGNCLSNNGFWRYRTEEKWSKDWEIVEDKLTKKEKVLACYPNLFTNCIPKVTGISKHYVYVTLKQFGLPVKRNDKPGYLD